MHALEATGGVRKVGRLDPPHDLSGIEDDALVGSEHEIPIHLVGFAALGGASAAEKATMLSEGISEAMNCTAFGLIVAIPLMVNNSMMDDSSLWG